ncbi:hypothetical protein KIN20_006241, partial [Parelaphostrongylus tenuis]
RKPDDTKKSKSLSLSAQPSALTEIPLTTTKTVSIVKPARKISDGGGSKAKEKETRAKGVILAAEKRLPGKVQKSSNEELRNKIAILHKQTRALRAEDPEVDKITKEVDECMKAVEDEKELNGRIAHRMRSEVDNRGKLDGMLAEAKSISLQIAEYYPDLLSNYSNSSGTFSYETIITPRRAERAKLCSATNVTGASEPCHFAHEVELFTPSVGLEVVDWDLVKRFTELLQAKERNQKTIEVQRIEKGTTEQSKKVIAEALSKFLSQPTGMAMNISTIPNNKPARLVVKVCPTERIRTPSAPLLTMEAIENAFHDDAHYITETEVVRAQTQLFRKKVQERKQKCAARSRTRPNFPKCPPVPESRSYGPCAMSEEFSVGSSEDTSS